MAEVKFKFVGDDSELRKKLANLSKIQTEMTDKFSKDLNEALSNSKSQVFKDITKEAANAAIQTDRLNKIAANKAIVNAKLEQIESIRRLREERSKEISNLITLKQIESEARTVLAEKKLITESLTQSEKALHNEYLKTGKDLNAYSLKLKEQAEERRKATQDERDAEKALKASEKARKDAEKEAAKLAKETAKRKKQLEQESSEYFKLNKALGAVRKETKDVLAEMFRMERQGHANTLGYEALKKKSEDLTKQTLYLDKGIKKIDSTLGLHQRNVGNYGSAIELLGPQFEIINQKLSLFGTSIDQLSQKGGFKALLGNLANFGKGVLAFITTPVGIAITSLGALFALFQANKQTVIDFDAGMKNVGKTTGMAGAELSSFGDAVIELSAKLQVVSTDKLLEYATVAGQLGVKGRADILAFSESLAMLETASNISGEEGGSSIARMLTLVDGGVQNVKAFGDEIVNLGNNFAATEKEILDNATQISQNVGIYRIGRQEVLAFATATKAVGLEAELVGSTFSRTLGEFEKTLRTGKGVADLLKVIGGNQEDLQRKFRQDAAGVFVDYVRGLNNIQKAGGSVNEALERTGIIAVRDQRVIASLATNGFDVLTDALDNVREANGAMQAEFENGASKLEQQSKRMSIAWDNFILSIESGEGVIAKFFLRLMGGVSVVIDALNKSFNPTSADEFTTRLTDIWGADRIREINLAVKDAESTIKKLSSVDISKATQKQINDLAKETESSVKSVNTILKTYKDLVNKGDLKDGGKNSISDVEATRNMLSSRLQQLNLFRKEENKINAKVEFEESEADKRKAERAKAAAARLVEQGRQAIERQRSLQGQIDSLAEQASRKQLSRDEEEIASILDKYNKMRDEVAKFYRDPKNAGKKVDTGKLAVAEKFEISEANTRQQTTELLKQLNQQRDLYAQYNAYVEENGIAAAEKMFGKQAVLAKGYREDLQREYMAITALQATASSTAFTGVSLKLTQAQLERAKELKAMLDALDKEDKVKALARYAEALRMAKTFSQKELEIRKSHNEALAQLGKDATDAQKAVLEESLKEQLTTLVESSPEFKKAMDNIDKSSQLMLANAFRTGKATVEKLIDGMHDATVEQKAALKKVFGDFFNKGAKDAELGRFDNISNAGVEFGNLVQHAIQFNKELDGGVDSLGQMVSSASKLASTIADTLGKSGESLGKAGGVFAIVGAVMQIVSGLVTSIQQSQRAKIAEVQAQADASHDRQMRATEAMTKALEIQLELIENIYGADRLAKYASSLTEITSEYTKLNDMLSGRYAMTGDSYVDGILKSLNEGKTKKQIYAEIADQYSVVSKEYMGADKIFKNLNKYVRLDRLPKDIKEAREELARLQRDIAVNGVDDKTQAIINQLEQQIDLYEKTANKLKEESTGNSFSSILSEVTQLFLSEGENAADAWSKGFDKIMENYLVQKFTRDYLQKAMQGWYDQMDTLSEGGLTESEKDQLKTALDAIRKEGDAQMESIKDLLGYDPTKSDSTSTLKGRINPNISESTGSEILGFERARYDIAKRSFDLMIEQSVMNKSCLAIANDKLIALNAIQVNTANTVIRLDLAVGHLAQIVKNTGGTSGRTAEGMGLS